MRFIFTRITIFVYLFMLPTSFVEAQQQVSAIVNLFEGPPPAAAKTIGEEQNAFVEFRVPVGAKWEKKITLSGFVLNEGMVMTVGHANEVREQGRCPLLAS